MTALLVRRRAFRFADTLCVVSTRRRAFPALLTDTRPAERCLTRVKGEASQT